MTQRLRSSQQAERAVTQVCSVLATHVRSIISSLEEEVLAQLEEVRIRVGRPLVLDIGGRSSWVSGQGKLVDTLASAYRITREDMLQTITLVTGASLYALEEELRRGFITIPGGHRVGFAGRALLDERSHVRGVKTVSSLNIRVARSVEGAANPLSDWLMLPTGRIASTLIVSPPQCGKTTLLRDLARQLSDGCFHPACRPMKVSIVDERSELAGSVDGIPQLNVGEGTDVMDACPKAEGINMMVRSMSPDIVITDEVGRTEDSGAILDALHAGVSVLVSAHGRELIDIRRRPALEVLMRQHVFDRYIVLSRRHGPCTIEGVYDVQTNPMTRAATQAAAAFHIGVRGTRAQGESQS